MKNPKDPIWIEPETFLLVVHCLNQLRHRITHNLKLRERKAFVRKQEKNIRKWLWQLVRHCQTTECNGDIKSCGYTKSKFLLLQTGQSFEFCWSQVTWWRQLPPTVRMAYVTPTFVMARRQWNYVFILSNFGINRLIISTIIKISDIQ